MEGRSPYLSRYDFGSDPSNTSSSPEFDAHSNGSNGASAQLAFAGTGTRIPVHIDVQNTYLTTSPFSNDSVQDPTMKIGVSKDERRREQRVESDLRRRHGLRERFAKLEETLPKSDRKSSQIFLLDRAVSYIQELKSSQTSLRTRLDSAEMELKELREVVRELARQHVTAT